MITERGGEIAQIVRGELLPLTDDERNEILQSRRSYYPDDLVVSGWIAALVYDTPEDALPLMQLLEYANSQLLEFRYYDEMLTRLLAGVYRRGGRWLRIPAKTNADSEGNANGIPARSERFSQPSDAGPSIVPEVLGFVKRNRSGAQRRKAAASGERGAIDPFIAAERAQSNSPFQPKSSPGLFPPNRFAALFVFGT